MRYHDDPRWDVSRLGQVEYNTGALTQWVPGVVRRHQHEFRPYQWRDPARARDWARLPPDLIALMQAEAAEEGQPPLELPTSSSRPPARGPGRRLDAVPWGRPPAPDRP